MALDLDTHDNVSVAVSDVVAATEGDDRPFRCLGAAADTDNGEVGDLSRLPRSAP